MKEFADNNFKFDENGIRLSKWVENNVGKGEIARHEQFLLSLRCLQKACFPGASKGVIVLEWFKPQSKGQLIPTRNPFYIEKKYRIWNKNYPACCNPTNYGESSHSYLILVASLLTTCHKERQRAKVLFYTVKNTQDPTGSINLYTNYYLLNKKQNIDQSVYLLIRLQKASLVQIKSICRQQLWLK